MGGGRGGTIIPIKDSKGGTFQAITLGPQPQALFKECTFQEPRHEDDGAEAAEATAFRMLRVFRNSGGFRV